MELQSIDYDLVVEQLLKKCRGLSETASGVFLRLRSAIMGHEYEKARESLEQMIVYGKLGQDIGHLVASLHGKEGNGPTFLLSSEILYLAYFQLKELQTESIIYGSGSSIGSHLTVDRLVPVELDCSEIGYASANISSSSQVLAQLESYGSHLAGYFHMHPGKGRSANQPSSIDMANQARLESGGHRAVGIIFSRDGYVRFFTDKLPFRVIIFGKGVDDVEPNGYRLTETKNLPLPRSKEQ